jgi:hypothetical protein
MKSLTLSILILFIISVQPLQVSAQKYYGKDDFRFLKKEYENLTPGVEFVLIKNKQEYDRVRKEHLGVQWDTISAFAYWNPKKGTCKIYIKDPSWKYEPELIGHEVAHCIWGRFHNGRKGMKP